MDRKYLKLRGGNWSFQLAVPLDLQAKLGTRLIEKSTGTSDLKIARRHRDALLVEARARFDRAREGVPFRPAEIQTEAEREVRRLYHDLASDFLTTFAKLPDMAAEVAEDLSAPVLAAVNSNSFFGGATTAERARAIIARSGAEPTEETVAELSKALLEAQAAAVAMLEKNIEPPPMKGTRRRRTGTAPRLSEAREQFLADRQGEVAPHTVRQYTVSLRMFVEFIGEDTTLDTVTRFDASEFLRDVSGLRADYARVAPAGLPLAKLLKDYAAEPGTPGLSAATMNKRLIPLAGLFDWAVKTGLLPEDHRNPFKGQHRKTANGSSNLPSEVEELAKLMERPDPEPARYTWASARPWVIRVALFSGMRLGEIVSLDAEDVKEEDGVPYFNVTDAKTPAGIRRVPIHSHLLDLGILAYVRHVGTGPLFPGIPLSGPDRTRAATVTNQFIKFRKARGVTRPKVTFHGFRKNVVGALERARVHQSEVAQVIGHERGFTFGVYSPLGLDLPGLREVVEKIAYPGLELS